jgi:hypothetical protein
MDQALFSPSRTRRYRGGCACGCVVYQANLDLTGTCPHAPSVWERKADTFELLRGEDALNGYQFSEEGVLHFFCERCGTRVYSQYSLAQRHFHTVDVKSLHVAPAVAPAATAYAS